MVLLPIVSRISLEALSFKAFNKNITNRFTSPELGEIEQQKEYDLAEKSLRKDLDKYKRIFNSLGYYMYKLNAGNFESEAQAKLKDSDQLMGLINISTALSYAEELRGLKLSINNRVPLEDEFGDHNDGQLGRKNAGVFRDITTQDNSVVIPLQVNMKMDGIAGMIPLQLFQIQENRLPLGYQDPSIAFIVKSETHSITSGQDWTTGITAQLVFLNKNKNTGSNASHKTKELDWVDLETHKHQNLDEMFSADTNSDWLRNIMDRYGVKENDYSGKKDGYYFGEINSLRGPSNKSIEYDSKIIKYDPEADITNTLSVIMGEFLLIINHSGIKSYSTNYGAIGSDEQYTIQDHIPTILQGGFNVRITGGIDLYHRAKFPNSTHNKGRSLDFVPTSTRYTKEVTTLTKITNEMEWLFNRIAEKYGCEIERFKAEYDLAGYTGARSGDHFHVQVKSNPNIDNVKGLISDAGASEVADAFFFANPT